jgi:hypothetical protein
MGLFLLGLVVGAVAGPVARLLTLEVGCRRWLVGVPAFAAVAATAVPFSPPVLLELLFAGAGVVASSVLHLVLLHPIIMGEE